MRTSRSLRRQNRRSQRVDISLLAPMLSRRSAVRLVRVRREANAAAMAPMSPGSPAGWRTDAEAHIRDHSAEAYMEARQRERDVVLPEGTGAMRTGPGAIGGRA